MSQLFEVGMLICFGTAWPVSIAKSLKMRSTKGKSLFFIVIVFMGYSCGIASKFLSGNVTYVVAFYILNLLMVSVDILLYFRNLRLDKLAAAAQITAGQD